MAASKSGSTLKQANDDVDQALINGIKGIYEIATRPGFINLDYADICTVFREKGSALMSIGTGRGENNIIDAVNNAIQSLRTEKSPKIDESGTKGTER
uniref:Cell division protein ftsZ n=1 Tax=Ascaris suum TaxID=6253 RepID=F1LI22_ASCSU